MKPRDIDRFFKELSKEIDFAATILLTGGAVAVLEGSRRVTRDLDFQVSLPRTSPERLERLQAAIDRVSKHSGIPAQYAEIIETWSSIAWPKTKRAPRLYRQFGKIAVRLLDPLSWSIGKLSRYLASDVADLLTVLKRAQIPPQEAVHAWGEALGLSPTSSAQPLFQRQVLHFLRQHSATLWGPNVDIGGLETLFLKSARTAKLRRKH